MSSDRECYWRQYNSWEIPGKGERGKCEVIMEETLLENSKLAVGDDIREGWVREKCGVSMQGPLLEDSITTCKTPGKSLLPWRSSLADTGASCESVHLCGFSQSLEDSVPSFQCSATFHAAAS